MKRQATKQIKVGNIVIGGLNKVIIQSMCNTKPRNIEDTINQILELENFGCEIIRVSIENEDDAFKNIPDVYDCVTYTREPMPVRVKPVAYYEETEELKDEKLH